MVFIYLVNNYWKKITVDYAKSFMVSKTLFVGNNVFIYNDFT
uniref:Uncharacterized protein n=1 Tax=Bartonella schoenbuchensis (strain DSM 13525 / NCTC 13165 / R1) TaxID=687861 RepID=E6YZB5_BARSR|nr:hypothetical protein B11C_40058 [Bartonella schoenbuchensis R1]